MIPAQHMPGQLCTNGCGTKLSIYNPYTVCGPCRVRLAEAMSDAELKAAEEAERAADGLMVWERYPRREVVRRGPLLRNW